MKIKLKQVSIEQISPLDFYIFLPWIYAQFSSKFYSTVQEPLFSYTESFMMSSFSRNVPSKQSNKQKRATIHITLLAGQNVAFCRAILIQELCLSVCPSRSSIISKWLHISSQFSSPHGSPNHSSFTNIKHLREIPTKSPPAGALNAGGLVGYKKFRDFRLITRYISQTIQDSAIGTNNC